MKKNSVIFDNPEEQKIFDLSHIGIKITPNGSTLQIRQENHLFRVGHVIYYDITSGLFMKAIAKNTIESEACGIVSKIISENEFQFVTSGLFSTDKCSYENGSVLYLSENTYGKLSMITPSKVSKEIGIKVPEGIMINIQAGLKFIEQDKIETLEHYTPEELQEIISEIRDGIW